MWKLKIFGLLLLGSCGVLLVSAESVAPEETTIKSDADEVTLSTELKPPPFPAVGEHRGIIYLINLFAVKNKTDKTTGEKPENALESVLPEVVGPLASLLFVADEGDEAGPLDDITKLVVDSDYEADDTDSEKGLKDVKVDPTLSEASKAVPDKSRKLKKSRSKRTIKKCKVCGGSGGYGGGGWPSGGGYNPHQSGGGGQVAYAVPLVVLLDGNGGRGHNRRQYQNEGGYGGGGGHHYGGGQNYGGGQYPSGGGYNSHPGGYGYGGGGGGSNAQASAYAQAQAGAYGK